MAVDIEEILGRELREVADGLHVPARPPLPQDPPRISRHRHALLVAAVVVLIIASAVAMEMISRGERALDPAPPAPTPSRTDAPIPTATPTATYELNRKLYAGGRRVPGTWLWVTAAGDTWVAWRDDLTWWWGQGGGSHQIEDVHDRAPSISPHGEYVGAVLGTTVEGDLVGFETRRGGEGLGATPVDLGPDSEGDPVRVRAVLDDGRIIAQGAASSTLWLPDDNDTVDLTRTAPDQEVRYNTPAGLVVTDRADGTSYLAEITDAGVLRRIRDLPSEDAVVSPGATWFAWTPPGTLGGEASLIGALRVESLDGSGNVTLASPNGWDFRVGEWTWEDDVHLVSPVAQDEGPYGERLARCSVASGRCVLIESP